MVMNALLFSFLRFLPYTESPTSSIYFFVSAIAGLLGLTLLIWGMVSAPAMKERIGWGIPLISFLFNFFFQPKGIKVEEIIPMFALRSIILYVTGAIAVYLIADLKQWNRLVLAFGLLVITDTSILWTIFYTFKIEFSNLVFDIIISNLSVIVRISIFGILFFYADRLKWKDVQIGQYPDFPVLTEN